MPGMMDREDDALMADLAAGGSDALAVLFARYHRQVYNYARLVLRDAAAAEDVLQDTFVAVADSAATYQPNERFQAWLMSICRHRCLALLERLRTRTRLIEASGFRVLELERAPRSAAEGYLQRERLSAALRALDLLPADQREAIMLYALEAMPYADIAAVLSKPLNTVKTLIRRARLHLAEALADAAENDHALPR
jgi:RNA polymerase sigma-70 factor (ECF subfamily)